MEYLEVLEAVELLGPDGHLLGLLVLDGGDEFPQLLEDVVVGGVGELGELLLEGQHLVLEAGALCLERLDDHHLVLGVDVAGHLGVSLRLDEFALALVDLRAQLLVGVLERLHVQPHALHLPGQLVVVLLQLVVLREELASLLQELRVVALHVSVVRLLLLVLLPALLLLLRECPDLPPQLHRLALQLLDQLLAPHVVLALALEQRLQLLPAT